MPTLIWLTRAADVKAVADALTLDGGDDRNSNLFIARNTGDHHDY